MYPKGAANVAAPLPIAPKAPASLNWDRFFMPVDDIDAGGEQAIYWICQHLFSTEKNSMTIFLSNGGKFPAHRDYIPMLVESVKLVANRKFGQKFAVSFNE